MALDEALFESIPDSLDFAEDLDNLGDPAEDWVSLFLEKSSLDEFDVSLGDLFPDGVSQPFDEAVTASPPSSGLTHQSGDSSSPDSKYEEAAGSGTERSDAEKKSRALPSSSEDSNSSRSTTKRLGKRKCSDQEEEKLLDDGEGDADEEEVKRRARLMRNRESAQLSRQRKKAYVDELEERLRALNATVAELNNTVNLISAENVNLRNQLAYFYHNNNNGSSAKPGIVPPIGVPVYPYHGGYMMRPGSSAPPVPIPRLKTQASSVKSVKRAKVSKVNRKADRKVTTNSTTTPTTTTTPTATTPTTTTSTTTAAAATGKTKKLASVAALGILCMLALVFPLDLGMPRSTQVSTWSRGSVEHSSRIGGRVLMAWDNESAQLDWGASQPGKDLTDSFKNKLGGCGGEHENRTVIDGRIFPANVSYGNSSHRFPTSLLFQGDNKLVKVDGDLIIQAVLAGDRAAKGVEKEPQEQQQQQQQQYRPQTPALLTSGTFQDIAAKALASSPVRALPVGENDTDDPQRKVLNDLAGTVFSTGVCTEVFQFEISPEASGAAEARGAATGDEGSRQKRQGYHRRNLAAMPLPSAKEEFKRKKSNATGFDDASEKSSSSSSSSSSMVVSVFNPKQVQSPGAKDLARIFVVVLVDSVRYVTYSCLLPQVVTG